MSYSTPQLVENVLAQALTTANPSDLTQPVNLIDIGTTRNMNTVPNDIVIFYIQQADSRINAALSQQYVVPVPQFCSFQMDLVSDINEYSTNISVSSIRDLQVGEQILITDGVNRESLVVSTVNSSTSFTPVSMPINLYAPPTRILVLRYPDPISYTSARLAAAAIYDKYFASQTEPGKTDFGIELRKIALNDMNNIREGRTIIQARRTGWRFANSNLVDRYTIKAPPEDDSNRSEPNQ